jgi:hypothetical protein
MRVFMSCHLPKKSQWPTPGGLPLAWQVGYSPGGQEPPDLYLENA